MARIFYLGAPSRVRLPPDATLERALSATGGNTGNLLIGQAIRRQLKAECIVDRRELGAEYISNNFDRVIVGASNFLYRNFDFSIWADFLERVKLPCTIIGLGAQAPDYASPVEVTPGTLKLIRIISDRSRTLGVRGPWSASVLSDLGIKNVRVVGCPAMFWNCKPTLEFKIPAQRRPLAVALSGAAQGVEHAGNPAAARQVEHQLTQLSVKHGYPYILQNALELAQLAAGEPLKDPALLPGLREIYGLSELSVPEFLKFTKQNTRIYFKIAEWHAALREFDFVLGSRFHGCLLAILAGVPSFIFAHDARTLEMCVWLNLPHKPVEQAGKLVVEELYESADLEKLQRTYTARYQNYIEFLNENGVEHVLKPAGTLLGSQPCALEGRGTVGALREPEIKA